MNPDDKSATKKFQKIQRAFDVLSNAEKREMYDRYGESFETMGPAAAGRPWGPRAGGGEFRAGPAGPTAEDVDFSQFFGERFGDARRGPGRPLRPVPPRRFAEAPLLPPPRRRHRPRTRNPLQYLDRRRRGATERAAAGGQVGDADGEDPRRHRRGQEDTHSRPRRAGGRQRRPRRHSTSPSTWRRTHISPARGTTSTSRLPLTLGEAADGAKIDVPTPTGAVKLTIPPGDLHGDEVPHQGARAWPRPAARRATCLPRRRS